MSGTGSGMGGLAAWASFMVLAGVTATMGQSTIRLQAGPHDYPPGPVWVDLPAGVKCEAYPIHVTDGSGRRIPAQADGEGHLCLLLEGFKAGTTLDLKVGEPDRAAKDAVSVEVTPPKATITLEGKAFTTYNFGQDAPRPFLFPVIGPTGEPMTRNFPMVKDVPGEVYDHKHHRSIWTAWGNINGVSHWEEATTAGVERHREFEQVLSGPVFGRIRAKIEWLKPTGERQLTEHRTYTFYRPSGDSRIIDVSVTFEMTDGDVTFGDTKEGGLVAIRVAGSMTQLAGGTIRNARGQKGMEQAWGKPAEWCDYYGPVKGQTVGFAIMDHPRNYGHPTPYHVRDYGLFTANPFGLRAFAGGDRNVDGSKTWKKGQSVTFRYRVLMHKGDTERANVAGQYTLFADPPKTAER